MAGRKQSPCTQLSTESFTPVLHLEGYQNSSLAHPWEGSHIPACPKAAGAARADVATLSSSLILGPPAGNHTS